MADILLAEQWRVGESRASELERFGRKVVVFQPPAAAGDPGPAS